jgi:hypothetical protein
MKKPRAQRLSFEFAFAYLLPVPAILGGLIWSAILLAVSWSVLQLDDFPLIKQRGGESVPTDLVILMFASSLMIGLLPHIVRLSAALEEWDLGKALAPTNSRQRWREEKALLAKNLPSGRALAPASILAVILGVGVSTQVIEISLDNLHHPSMIWVGILMIGLFLLLLRGMAFTHFAKKRRMPALEEAEHVDLLDLSPQHRVARCAVRSCSTWIAGATLSSLFFLLGSNWLTQSIIAVVAFVAALSLLPTVLRMQRRIHRAKVLELARLQRDVHAARDVVLKRTPNANSQSIPPGRLADLLSYVEHVENLPELPFHKGKLAIGSLYFAVPLGSWLIISGVQNLFNLTFS